MSFSFNSFDSGFGFPGAQRKAAYPPLNEEDTDTVVHQLTRGALSGLGYVGSTLDKLFGGRAVRGALGGRPGELLSVIPGSDVMGLTDEANIVSGADLYKNVTGRDPSQGGWAERNLVGPAVELALDPSLYLGGIGALTKAGQAAAKVGTVTPGLLAGVRAGEKSLHPLVGLASKVAPFKGAGGVPLAKLAAADALEGAGALARRANVGVRKVPGVVPFEDLIGKAAGHIEVGARSLFDRPSGFVPERLIQGEHRAIKHPADLAAARATRLESGDLYDTLDTLLQETGYDPAKVQRHLYQRAEDLVPDEPLIGPHNVGVGARLEALGNELRRTGRYEPAAIEEAAGLPLKRLVSESDADYAMRRRLAPTGRGGGVWENLKNAVGGRARLLPTSHGSFTRRKEAIRDWLGGTMGIEDVMTPELAGARPTLPPGQIVDRLLQNQIDQLQAGAVLAAQKAGTAIPTSPVITPAQLAALRDRAKGMRRWLKTVPAENIEGAIPGQARLPFFDPDPIKMAVTRKKLSLEGKGSADTIFSVIGKAAIPAQGLGGPGARTSDVPVLDILRQAGLTSDRGLARAVQSLGIDPRPAVQAAQAAAQAAGGTVDLGAVFRGLLQGRALPHAQGSKVARLLNRYQIPEELQPWVKLADSLQNAWKTGIYTVWPGSLMRNVGSGGFENVAEGGVGPRGYATAGRSLEGRPTETGIASFAGLSPAEQSKALRREAYIEGATKPGQGEMAERIGTAPMSAFARNPLAPHQSVSGQIGDFLGGVRQKGWRGLGAYPELMRGLGETAENRLRMSQFAELRRQGWNPAEAAKRVEATHFDYGSLSDFENQVMKRLMPFYTFPRKNLPKQVRRAVVDPKWTSGPLRFSGMLQDEEGGNYVPDYLRSGVALPLGQSAPGVEQYLSSLGLPLEEAFGRLKVGQNPFETAFRSGEGYLGMLRPEIKAPLEAFANRQFFTGRDLSDLHIGKIENFLSLGNEDAGRLISQFLTAMPSSRAVSTANRLLDERKYAQGPARAAIAQLLPLLSGVKVSDVDIDKWRNIDARKQLERLMQSAQHLRESRSYFADKQARLAGQVTPAEAEMLSAYSALKQRAEEKIAEQRRRVGVQGGR